LIKIKLTSLKHQIYLGNNMVIKLPINTVPLEETVFEKLANMSGIRNYPLKSAYDISRPVSLQHSLPIDNIKNSVLEILKNNQPAGWLSKSGNDNSYSGVSIVYNPTIDTQDKIHQTIGSDTNSGNEFFYNQVAHLTVKKNTYFDSYSFRKISPAITGALLNLIKEFRFSPIRSRIAIVDANYYNEKTADTFGWHRDERVFENLRINIPIITDPDCLFQMENLEPEFLEYGNVYSWDTNLPHRVFPAKKKNFQRIHIVLGFSPWFDYVEEEDAWVTNDFFGKKHPLDMLIDGEFHPLIKGLK